MFAAADENAGITISYQYSSASSFAPNVTPIYDLTDDDFKVDRNEDPLQVTRSDPYQAYNVWRLEIAERVNAYNLTTVESRDQNAIELYGMRIAATVTAHEICDPNVALLAGQLMVQRAVYIRNTYKFRLSWEYCLLDPMDLVTVSDSILGLANAPIRIAEIEEDENGFLQVTAEEFPLGAATATLYATQAATNTPINRNLASRCGQCADHLRAAGGACRRHRAGLDRGVGRCGRRRRSELGRRFRLAVARRLILFPDRHRRFAGAAGRAQAALPAFAATNPDSADTLTVNMAESGGVLSSATALDAQLANTLSIVDGELVVLRDGDADFGEPLRADLALSRPLRHGRRGAFAGRAVRAARRRDVPI